MPTPRFSQIELHIHANPEFPRRFGKAVKAAGGRYSAARGNSDTRFVFLPIAQTLLIDQIIKCYGGPKTPAIARDFVDPNEEHAPSWVHVQYVGSNNPTPTATIVAKVDAAMARADARNYIRREQKPLPATSVES